MKFFKRSAWVLLSVFFGIGFGISAVGTEITKIYEAQINDFFEIDSYELVETAGSESMDTEYYKSDYYKANGSYDDKKMRDNSLALAKEVGLEGATLLWNNENTLPLAKDSKLSLFGIAAVEYLFGGEGSGHIGVTTSENMKDVLENEGFKVNSQLWNAYRLNRAEYGGRFYSVPEIDPNYLEFAIDEVPWKTLNSTTFGDVSSSIAQYGDAAVMVIARNGSENGDVAFKTKECLDECYLDLSLQEVEILNKLEEYKQSGVIKKIVLLINSANAVQFKNIKNFDIDACMWVGMSGNSSYHQIADLLCGDANPSGHLVNAYVYDNDSAAVNENFGNFTFTESAGVPPTSTYSHNTKYVVYQEGIYVGYRYYETRYEDLILGGRNANGSAGVVAGENTWSYTDEVAYPFGYGSSYTQFEYSDYSVKKVGENYEVSLTIENVGDTYMGKDVMQVYLQKPYTEYDIANKVEKSAVDLVGFAKTKNLAPGEKQTLTVKVKGEEFKTYDSYGAGTYILEKGDYYLTVGTDSHDAVNNILAAKGKTTADGMDKNGNAEFVEKIAISADDFEKYSQSSVTGNKITNQFEDVDINLYEGTKGQEIVYLSRNDWQGTYPSAVKLTCTSEIMLTDMQYGFDPEEQEGDEMPLYDTVGSYGQLTLAMLKNLEYDDPMWEELLNQLTWEETNKLCSYGAGAFAGAESIAAPGGRAKDGPCGISSANANLNSFMAFPSNTLVAATWNEELIERMGDAFGMEILHIGFTGIYGPGANMHRSAYSGRNWEYFSEDAFLSGKMFAAESRGLRNRGVIMVAKHFALNDQETNRCGTTTWANEQTVRENYLKAFEIGIVEGNCNGLMSSFNRFGCTWAGSHKGLLTEVLRNEWGFLGIVETDAAVGAHMTCSQAFAEGIVAGNDLWMSGGGLVWDYYKDNATVCQALRESAHRILYTQLNSNAMNGLSSTTMVVKITPWWLLALMILTEWLGIFTGTCAVLAVISFIKHGVDSKKKNNKAKRR